MAQVFNNSMTAHVWAQQSQDSGKSNNGNFYFTGPTLYSYGSHFVVGHIMPDGVALLNGDSYSISTSGHQYDARAAVRGRYFTVPRLTKLVELIRYARDLRSAETRKRIREFVLDGMAHHRLDDDAAAYLLGVVGLRSVDAIKREAARLVAREAKAREAKKRSAALAVLQDFTGPADDRAFRLHVLARLGQWSDAGQVLETMARDVRSAMRVLGKAGTPKRLWAASQARLKALPPASELEAAKGAHFARASMRGRIQAYRRAVNQLRHDCATRLAIQAAGGQETPQNVRDVDSALNNLFHAAGGILASGRYVSDAQKAAMARLREAIGPVQEATRTQYYDTLAAQRERDRIERERSEAERRANWFAGLPSSWSGRKESGAAYIRATGVQRDESGAIIGGTLETSQGATVPLCHAIRVFRFVKKCRETGTDWRTNGKVIRVGHFQVDSISATGDFVAGCHRFDWSDIAELAASLGVLDIAPDDSAVERRA